MVGFQNRADAERFLVEFRERLVRFGLELHPDTYRAPPIKSFFRFSNIHEPESIGIDNSWRLDSRYSDGDFRGPTTLQKQK